MAKYIVIEGLPKAVMIKKNLFRCKVDFYYDGELLEEDKDHVISIKSPIGTTKKITYKKAFLGRNYPQVFLNNVQISYLLPFESLQIIVLVLPFFMILNFGLIGLFMSLLTNGLVRRIYRHMEGMLVSTIISLSIIVIVWFISLFIGLLVFSAM